MKSRLRLSPVIFRELFFAASAFCIVLITLESLAPGVVAAYFNLNYGLILWVLSGILYIYSRDTDTEIS